MAKLLIIADDFTGSLDTGVQFSKHGINTLVEVMHNEEINIDKPCDVLVVDTDSRHISPELSYVRIQKLVKVALRAGFDYIFKKTDSMLRGNIGSELAALLESSPENELIFMPAYPKAGRFTIKGKHYLENVPLTSTDFANDHFNPINSDNVKDIIHEQTQLPVDCIYYDQYDKLKENSRADKTIIVVDGRNDTELSYMCKILNDANKLTCLAGCAGFAEFLPYMLDFECKQSKIETISGNRLIVSGSLNPIALSQVSFAINNCGYSNQVLTLEQKLALDEDVRDYSTLELVLNSQGKAVIWSKGTQEDIRKTNEMASKKNLKYEDVPILIANNIGKMVGSVIKSGCVQSLIIFGGDTLLGIAKHLGCSSIMPISEVLPGVVFCRFNDEKFAHIDIITKAGGFGSEEVIDSIDKFLDIHLV